MERIRQLLEAIGSSPDEVAATLRGAGIHGLRDSTSFLNPIIRYLNQNIDIGGRLEVSAAGTSLHLLRGGKLQQMELPLAVQVFLDSFHQGFYPELETESSPVSTPIPPTRPAT